MSKGFAPKPIAMGGSRPSGAEIRDLIQPAVRGVAVQVEQDAPQDGRGRAPKPRAVPTVQVNFRVSEDFAKLIAIELEKAGGMRRWFAQLVQQAGHEVPSVDLNPPTSRREW